MQSFISDLGTFIVAVVTNWAGYSTGGVIVALIALWGVLKGHPVPRGVGIALAAIFLLLGFFKAWREQYNLATSRAAAEVTYLKPNISQVFIGKAGKDNKDLMVGATGRISNLGASGSAETIGIDLELSGGKVIHGEMAMAPDQQQRIALNYTLGSNRPMFLWGSDHWEYTAIERPIPSHGSATGWSVAMIKGITFDEVAADKGAAVIVSCYDVTGRKTSQRLIVNQEAAKTSNPLFGVTEMQPNSAFQMGLGQFAANGLALRRQFCVAEFDPACEKQHVQWAKQVEDYLKNSRKPLYLNKFKELDGSKLSPGAKMDSEVDWLWQIMKEEN